MLLGSLKVRSTALDWPGIVEPVSREIGFPWFVPLANICQAWREYCLGSEVANVVLAVTRLYGECADNVFEGRESQPPFEQLSHYGTYYQASR